MESELSASSKRKGLRVTINLLNSVSMINYNYLRFSKNCQPNGYYA